MYIFKLYKSIYGNRFTLVLKRNKKSETLKTSHFFYLSCIYFWKPKTL
ncbi:hypothetical protein RCH33_1419 [Flavobacterium daejeonense]|nr:hypothetical protein RCH33_1419 [Flavobacterium daejeonense]